MQTRLRILFVFFIFMLLLSNRSFSFSKIQNDTVQKSKNKYENIQYINEANQKQSDFIKDSEIERQKLLKLIFLIGFIFMFVFVFVIIYIYHTKIKEISKFIQTQNSETVSNRNQIKILSLILNNVNNSIALISHSGDFLWVNQAFTSLFGYSLENIAQKKDFPVLYNYKNMQIQDLINKNNTEKAYSVFTYNYITDFGREVNFRRKIMPIVDNDNQIVNFVLIDNEQK